MLRSSAVILSIVTIVSLASHHCASYEKTDLGSLGRKGNLSILVVPYPGPSHMMGLATLGEKLIEQGHRVTFGVAEIFNAQYPDFGRQIANSTGMALLSTSFKSKPCFSDSTNWYLGRYMPNLKNIVEFKWRLSRISEQIVEMLDGPSMKSWDIVVGEYLLSPIVGPLARKWNVPIVHFSNALDYIPSNLPFWSYPLYGTGYTDDLTFLQRLHLTLVLPIIKTVVHSFETIALSSSGLTDKRSYILPGTVEPYIITTSFGFEYPRPVLPLIHYVGPIVKSERTHKLLQGPLKSWLDSKPDSSVIMVSMGTTAKVYKLQVTAITNGILATHYNVLWSTKTFHPLIHRLAGIQNEHRVFLSEWLPQQAALRHSSIAMAILHGGKGGVSQCLYNGVPGIIIPFALDRYDIAARVVSSGAGLTLFKHELTAERVTEAITTVSAPRYKNAALRLRKIFLHDGGAEKAVDLVEFYAEVGYAHQIPAYTKYQWSWIQYYNVDVYALLLTVLALIVYGTFRVSKRSSRQWCNCFPVRKRINSCHNLSLIYALLLVILIVIVYMTFAEWCMAPAPKIEIKS